MTSEKGSLYSLTRETGATVPLHCSFTLYNRGVVFVRHASYITRYVRVECSQYFYGLGLPIRE